MRAVQVGKGGNTFGHQYNVDLSSYRQELKSQTKEMALSRIADTEARAIMLEHVTASLWASVILALENDAMGACGRLELQSLSAAEEIYERANPRPRLRSAASLKSILLHQKRFWDLVGARVRSRQNGAGKPGI